MARHCTRWVLAMTVKARSKLIARRRTKRTHRALPTRLADLRHRDVVSGEDLVRGRRVGNDAGKARANEPAGDGRRRETGRPRPARHGARRFRRRRHRFDRIVDDRRSRDRRARRRDR